ncbi:DUF4215 domain-containing protein [Myxococcota bacterium]
MPKHFTGDWMMVQRRVGLFFGFWGGVSLVATWGCSSRDADLGPTAKRSAKPTANADAGTASPANTSAGTAIDLADAGASENALQEIDAGPICGDVLVNQAAEECDDGNRMAGDGCSSACKREPFYLCPPEGGVCLPEMVCGDLAITSMEQCDDGNNVPGDGCSAKCQVEAIYWHCPNEGGIGGTCVNTALCGDGRTEGGEVCDDGNAADGDGCAADCLSVEAGWVCRKPGVPCTPQCGDGTILAGWEECDDGNRDNGDGCSATCRIEPGYLCTPTAPSSCTSTECGDGIPEGTEHCDLGPDNGLFYGDGSGCSISCTKEPACRPEGGGPTHACESVCGDGMKLGTEACDDGNLLNEDGCSDQCLVEDGFLCSETLQSDARPCRDGGGDCLVLPIILRDFKGQNESGGHPDFFYMGAQGIGGKTICVPDAGCDPQDPDCPEGDVTPWCLGLVEDSLGPNGKPVLNSARAAGTKCDCTYTDWDGTGVLGGAATGTETESGSPQFQGLVPMVQSAASFAQWYTDVPGVNTVVRDVLELPRFGTVFQFSSSDGDTVKDDISAGATLKSGFFPLEDQPSAKLCNLWPYWTKWSGCSGDQWDQSSETTVSADGMLRNFYFTTEARYLMVYQGGESLEFFGDDDVWVFINGRLALDLGGTHQQLKGSVTLAAGGDPRFELEVGNVYEIVVFHADRHPRDSNYQLTLSGFETERSSCSPECGNGIATLNEECDLGLLNNDLEYGGCRTDCTHGPFCGDGFPDLGYEICDDGLNTATGYDAVGCAPGCVPAPRCGDGVLHVEFGEQCDNGDELNVDGVPGACSTLCLINPRCGDGIAVPESGEECDYGPANEAPELVSYGGCTTECKLGPYCGDGKLDEAFEKCDDGNYIPNDLCSPICRTYGPIQ